MRDRERGGPRLCKVVLGAPSSRPPAGGFTARTFGDSVNLTADRSDLCIQLRTDARYSAY
jgi:hypothetical protein